MGATCSTRRPSARPGSPTTASAVPPRRWRAWPRSRSATPSSAPDLGLPAVILVGGEGTRLRPLTARVPKPMLPLVDRPLLAYTFEHLRRHGVEREILSCGYLPTQLQAHFGGDAGGLALEYCREDEPLGTGGAIGFGARGLEGTFLALNGDS